jgi:hypothetical protein
MPPAMIGLVGTVPNYKAGFKSREQAFQCKDLIPKIELLPLHGRSNRG